VYVAHRRNESRAHPAGAVHPKANGFSLSFTLSEPGRNEPLVGPLQSVSIPASELSATG
jgi:hypothetical protein